MDTRVTAPHAITGTAPFGGGNQSGPADISRPMHLLDRSLTRDHTLNDRNQQAVIAGFCHERGAIWHPLCHLSIGTVRPNGGSEDYNRDVRRGPLEVQVEAHMPAIPLGPVDDQDDN